jgi:hypothetical protein
LRIYLPATVPLLERWLAAGDATPETAYAVTPSLREWYHEADLDELEHAASVDASIGSLELLAADPTAPRRRVVVAAEIADDLVRPASDRGRAIVTVGSSVPLARWASALVDGLDAEPVVATAVHSLAAAATGDDDAQFALDEAEAHELGWYAVQELRYLSAASAEPDSDTFG